jgi:hypothetical protein
MTVLMECVTCKVTVVNPRIMNYMLEMCDPCELRHNEMANRAIDTHLHEKAEAQRDAQFKNHPSTR